MNQNAVVFCTLADHIFEQKCNKKWFNKFALMFKSSRYISTHNSSFLHQNEQEKLTANTLGVKMANSKCWVSLLVKYIKKDFLMIISLLFQLNCLIAV